MSFCPPDTNNGFIELQGPLQQSYINSILIDNPPSISLSFAPRTTIPSILNKNRLDESTENTCTYNGKKYILVSVQLCSVIHKGYLLPGQNNLPLAELVLSFTSSSPPININDTSGILFCFPIYESNRPQFSGYLDQLINPNYISCSYQNESNKEYDGNDYKTINNSSLSDCLKTCCDDPNCLVYTFKSGTCHLKNKITNLLNVNDSTIISGKINRNQPKVCSPTTVNDSSIVVSTLESLFYSTNSDIIQSSIAYKTCFETKNVSSNEFSSNSLYIFVFPNGIKVSRSVYDSLVLLIGGSLQQYELPPAIRRGEPTLYGIYKGKNINSDISNNGYMYTTLLSTCGDEFTRRFEYFTKPPTRSSRKKSSIVEYFINPPRLFSSIHKNSEGFTNKTCYTTDQYKCVPFNESTDLSGNLVIPKGTSLNTILDLQRKAKNASGLPISNTGPGSLPSVSTSFNLTSSELETIAAISIVGLGLLIIGGYAFSRPSSSS
jgi:hypothetical protein